MKRSTSMSWSSSLGGRSKIQTHHQNRLAIIYHPIYAGAYVYGRRPTDPKKQPSGRSSTERLVMEWSQWEVLLKGRFPAYISWEQYEKNQRQIASNRIQNGGVPRQGSSLLAGLLVCGRCGWHLAALYSNNGSGLRYTCHGFRGHCGEEKCQSLCGPPLDELVTTLVLEALQPAALEPLARRRSEPA